MDAEELLKQQQEEGTEEIVPPVDESSQQEEVEELPPATPAEAASTSLEGTPTPEQPPIVEENGAVETSIKTFTQDDVDKLVGETRVKTREKTFNYIYNRYGVKNEEELDSLVANSQRYDTLKEETAAEKASWETERSERDGKLSQLSEEIALMKSGVDANRYEDVKLILKGKGMEVTAENIEAELQSHPEWKSVAEEEKKEETPAPAPTPIAPADGGEGQPAPTVTTRIKTLGNEPKPAPAMSEEEQAEKLFKMKFH